jgi:hypothetical protein
MHSLDEHSAIIPRLGHDHFLAISFPVLRPPVVLTLHVLLSRVFDSIMKQTTENYVTMYYRVAYSYFLNHFAVLCPVIFIFLSISFFPGIVASYFYHLFSSLRPFSLFTYTFNILLYFCSVFDKFIFEIHIGRCSITVDFSPSFFFQILRCFADNNKTYM